MKKSSTTEDFFVEQTEKSFIKSAIVHNFFRIYLRIINSHFNKKMYYIDLFSGPGKYENGSDSTPMYILDAIQSYDNGELLNRIQCVFNEADTNLYKKLVDNVKSHEMYNKLSLKPIITNIDAAKVDLSCYLNNRFPVFSFVDPFGYKSTSAKQIWSLVRNIGSDCIFFFNANRIILDFSKPNKDSDFKELFGKYYNSLADRITDNISHHQKMVYVLEAFSRNLKDIVYSQNYEYKLFILPFGFCFDDREKESHYLLFISKNHKAVEEMKKIMNKFATSISEMYTFDSKTVDQLSLFNLEDDGYINFKKTVKKLRTSLLGKTWTLKMFCEEIDSLSMQCYHKVTPFTEKEIKYFLRRYYNEGFIISKAEFSNREIFAEKRTFKLKDE